MKFPIALQYSPMQKAAHWLTVLFCLSQFPTAWAIQRTHVAHRFGFSPDPFDLFLHKIHAWSGWAIFLLAMALVALRAIRGAPELPHGMPIWQRCLARLAHFSLYAGIAVLAATGTGAMYFSQRFVPIHILLVNLGIGLVLLHVIAVIWHQAVRGDGLLWRMMPKRKGTLNSTPTPAPGR
jgi:cytochrome b561